MVGIPTVGAEGVQYATARKRAKKVGPKSKVRNAACYQTRRKLFLFCAVETREGGRIDNASNARWMREGVSLGVTDVEKGESACASCCTAVRKGERRRGGSRGYMRGYLGTRPTTPKKKEESTRAV